MNVYLKLRPQVFHSTLLFMLCYCCHQFRFTHALLSVVVVVVAVIAVDGGRVGGCDAV